MNNCDNLIIHTPRHFLEDGRMKTTEFTAVRVSSTEDLPEKIRKYFKNKMEWYHEQGKFLNITADVLLEKCPTFLVYISGGIILIQNRGGDFLDFAVDVFNADGVIIDAKNYMYPQTNDRLPEKWPDGTPVANARTAMQFIPPDQNLKPFTPPQ